MDVNPSNSQNLVGMWQEERWSTGGARNLVFGTSLDGGATWRNIALQGVGIVVGGEFQRVTDPWVDFGPSNRVYGTSLAFDDTGPDNAIFVHTSTDGGQTWGTRRGREGHRVRLLQRPPVAHGRRLPASPFYGRVYGWDRLASKGPGYAYTGDGLIAYSADGGATFSDPVVAVPTGNNEQTLTNLPVVLPDGTVLDVGTYYPNQASTRTPGSSSSPARRTAGRPGARHVPRGPEACRRPRHPLRRRCSERHCRPTERDGLRGLAGLAVLKGKRDDVLLIRSTDQGRTWSAPIKVNDTPAGAQAAFLPTVKVDANGRVGVVYYDLRDDTNPRDGSFITTEWITFSTDGGRTFGPSASRARLRSCRRGFRGRLLPGRLPGAGRQRDHVHAVLRRDARDAGHGQVGSDIFATKAG